jgi:hypothetical protein
MNMLIMEMGMTGSDSGCEGMAVAAKFATALLHSTCISRSAPPAWPAATVPLDGFRTGGQRV